MHACQKTKTFPTYFEANRAIVKVNEIENSLQIWNAHILKNPARNLICEFMCYKYVKNHIKIKIPQMLVAPQIFPVEQARCESQRANASHHMVLSQHCAHRKTPREIMVPDHHHVKKFDKFSMFLKSQYNACMSKIHNISEILQGQWAHSKNQRNAEIASNLERSYSG